MRDAAIVDAAGVRSQDFGVRVVECVYCGGIGCVDQSLSGANVSAKSWDGSQLPILDKRAFESSTNNIN